MSDNLDQVKSLIDGHQKFVILQADNPDGDSLASSLALEQILTDLGKHATMYCAVNIPTYLRHLKGWDRVVDRLPVDFEASIIVDTSSLALFDNLASRPEMSLLQKRPCLVIDHHMSESTINFPTVVEYKHDVVATGQLIYDLAKQFDWPLALTTKEMIVSSIMSDSLGLISEGTSADTIRVVADMVEGGVNLAKLDDARKELMRKSPELIAYKGRLLERVEFHDNNRVAIISIPWDEIEKYSPLYNPTMLVLDEMRYGEGTDIAIGFKVYKDGRVTAKIKTNFGKGIAAELAEHFGGGGHRYASGFKITTGKPFNEIKSECIAKAGELLDKLEQGNDHEIQ